MEYLTLRLWRWCSDWKWQGQGRTRNVAGWVKVADEMTAEVEGMDLKSQGVGSMAHVDTEILQNCHQSGLGESSGESKTEASRNRTGKGERDWGRWASVADCKGEIEHEERFENPSWRVLEGERKTVLPGVLQVNTRWCRGCSGENIWGAAGEAVSWGVNQVQWGKNVRKTLRECKLQGTYCWLTPSSPRSEAGVGAAEGQGGEKGWTELCVGLRVRPEKWQGSQGSLGDGYKQVTSARDISVLMKHDKT